MKIMSPRQARLKNLASREVLSDTFHALNESVDSFDSCAPSDVMGSIFVLEKSLLGNQDITRLQ